jgi:hypothetical protein
MFRADPVNGAFHLPVGTGHAMAGFRIQGTVQLDRRTATVLDQLGAADDTDAAQTDLAIGLQPVKAFGRNLGKIVAFDPQLARKRYLAHTEVRVFRVVWELQCFFMRLGKIGEYQLQRVEHSRSRCSAC